MQRGFVAGALWTDASEDRSQASLRSAVWRLRRPGHDLIESHGNYLGVSEAVVIDVREASALARHLADGVGEVGEDDLERTGLANDLLPDWYEDWVTIERERLRQLRLHALEMLCRRLTACGRHCDAVQAGLAAVNGEPLRESAQRALIEAHIAEGNISEAIRQYRVFATLIKEELNLEPSRQIRELMDRVSLQ
jgi:DNA-binding SARP family transcriptional activator